MACSFPGKDVYTVKPNKPFTKVLQLTDFINYRQQEVKIWLKMDAKWPIIDGRFSFKCIPKSKGITVKTLVRLRRSGICLVRFIERNHFFFFSFGHSLVKKLKHRHLQVYRDKLLLRGDLRFPVTSETAEKEGKYKYICPY